MPNDTAIEWTDLSANLLKYRDASGKIVWHCEKTSPGCAHYYSEAIAHRYKRGGPFAKSETPKVTPFFDDKEAAKILRAKNLSGKRVFIDDMTDLFGEWVPDEIIDRHFAVFALRPDVTFQVLTKRAERMREYFDYAGRKGLVSNAIYRMLPPSDNDPRFAWPLRNVWLGCSVEDQQRADERIPHLLATPAAVRFLSCEPLWGPVDLSENNWLESEWAGAIAPGGIHWVIVGGESGHKARPMDIAWARSIVQQCKAAGVPCFVKQLGSQPHNVNDGSDRPNAGTLMELAHRKGGDMNEWPADLRVREFPAPKAVTV